jgi:hypothetical protein
MEKDESGKQNTFYFKQSKLESKLDQQKIPLAIVLGWVCFFFFFFILSFSLNLLFKAGAVDNNVYKYVQIYNNFGYHTIRFAPTTKLTLFQTQLHKKYALKLLDLLLDHTENPIIFHTFSNAGLFLYRHLSEIVHENEKYLFLRKNVKILISDGGPGFPAHYFQLVQNMSEIMESHVSLKPIRYAIATGGIAAFLIKNNIIFNDRNYFSLFLKAMVNDKFRVPTLIFYSKTDRLVSWTYILDYVNKRREAIPDINIKTVEFFGTEHVSNYLKYPKVYFDHLKNHILEQNLPIYDENDNLPMIKSQL